MNGRNVSGLSLFLMATVNLIASGKRETTADIEAHMGEGIASYLAKKYADFYGRIGVDANYWKDIDDYYRRNWIGFVDGEKNKHICDENDGLPMLVCLVLNEI